MGDPKLSKQQTELLATRLQQWDLLAKSAKVTAFKKRNEKLTSFFTLRNKIHLHSDNANVMEKLGFRHNLEKWRFFIDSSKLSPTVVFLHNGNTKPSNSLTHSVDVMEIMKVCLWFWIYYWRYLQVQICCDRKINRTASWTTGGIYEILLFFYVFGTLKLQKIITK